MWFLAQTVPKADLLKGDVQEILVWVVLAQVALYLATVIYFIKRQGAQEDKYDLLQAKTHRQLARSNRAIEAVANLPPPKEDEND